MTGAVERESEHSASRLKSQLPTSPTTAQSAKAFKGELWARKIKPLCVQEPSVYYFGGHAILKLSTQGLNPETVSLSGILNPHTVNLITAPPTGCRHQVSDFASEFISR